MDPTARSAFYNANQTRYGIPAASQQWEQQRDRWARRHVIWDILDARKTVAA